VGSAYTQQLAVGGGRAPYLWVAGPVPPGLTLHQDGNGTWTISVSAVDDSAPPQLADASLQLIVH
jgi:hypothetical protein